MLHKTKGIVFRFTRYGETSIIVNIFTELFGLQTYIVNGVRSSTKKPKIALYQPLTLLDLVVYHKEHASILRIKEVKCYHPYQTLPTDIRKSAVAMFISEVLNRCVKEQSHAAEIHEFIAHSLITLDRQQQVENFHLIFLLQLSKFLGFGPNTSREVVETHWLADEDEIILTKLLTAGYGSTIQISYGQRQTLLSVVIRFYSTHIDGLAELKSLPVLREILQ